MQNSRSVAIHRKHFRLSMQRVTLVQSNDCRKNTKMSRIISPLQGCGASAKSVILIHQERPSLGRHTTKAEVCAGVG
jgi:hypothetical protein